MTGVQTCALPICELNKLLLKRIAHGEIVEYCEDVLKSLNSRTWDLGNVIKYRQLTGK